MKVEKTGVLLCKRKRNCFSQSVPISINEFVEITIFLSLTCYSIHGKMQGFIDESVSLLYLFLCLTQIIKMAAKSGGAMIFAKSSQ